MRKIMWATTFGFLLLTGIPARAQDRRLEISGNAGYTLSDGVTGDSIRGGDGNIYNSIDPKDSFSWNLTLGYFVTEQVEVEGLFSNQASTLVIGGTTTRDIGDMSVQNYHGGVSYNFGEESSKARPYFYLGLGATHYGGTSFTAAGGQTREILSQTKFSTTWGAGVKIYPGNSVGFKLGVRWTPTYIKSDAAGWWCDPYWGCYVVGDAQYANQFEFTGGITLRF
jgi:outer membrane protein W